MPEIRDYSSRAEQQSLVIISASLRIFFSHIIMEASTGKVAISSAKGPFTIENILNKNYVESAAQNVGQRLYSKKTVNPFNTSSNYDVSALSERKAEALEASDTSRKSGGVSLFPSLAS